MRHFIIQSLENFPPWSPLWGPHPWGSRLCQTLRNVSSACLSLQTGTCSFTGSTIHVWDYRHEADGGDTDLLSQLLGTLKLRVNPGWISQLGEQFQPEQLSWISQSSERTRKGELVSGASLRGWKLSRPRLENSMETRSFQDQSRLSDGADNYTGE